MNSDIKKEWINALKSGNYEKTIGGLRKDNQYCCLGVLCDIVKDKYNLEWSTKKINMGYFSIVEEDRRWADYIPEKIGKDINLGKKSQAHLASLNDLSEDWTEVIEYIEENL